MRSRRGLSFGPPPRCLFIPTILSCLRVVLGAVSGARALVVVVVFLVRLSGELEPSREPTRPATTAVGKVEAASAPGEPAAPESAAAPAEATLLAHHAEEDIRVDAHAASATAAKHVGHVQVVTGVVPSSLSVFLLASITHRQSGFCR